MPPAEFSRWQDDQISSGWSGPHSCQAFTTAAAIDDGQVRYADTAWGAACVLNCSSVTTPKLPLPAPRSAQNRSLFSLALATSCLPSAVISVAWVRLSQVRPYARETTPWPPPRVRPETPTVGQEPAGIVTPFAARPRYTSISLAPAPTTAEEPLARILFSFDTSRISRPSPEDQPA